MRSPLALVVGLTLVSHGFGQGTRTDYDRAAALGERFGGKVVRDQVRPTWYADGTFVYTNRLPDGKSEAVLVDPVAGTRTVVTAAELAAKKPVETKAKPAEPEKPVRPRKGNSSPDGKWTAVVRDHNVVLQAKDGTETRLSTDGTATDGYGRIQWSPDSKRLVAIRTAAGGDRVVTLVESSPKDQLQPRTHTYAYLKPGDAIPRPKPHLFDVATGKEIPVSDELFPNPWGVTHEHWSPDDSRFFFVYNQRGHQVVRVLAIDAATGAVSEIVKEECKTFFDYTNKLDIHFLDATGEILWMSERDGWNHVYLIDAKTGTLKNAVTSGKWVVLGVDRVDESAREIHFRLSGIDADQDPYHVHHARIKFDGTGLVRLTDADGNHGPLEFSPDGKTYLVTHTRVDLPPVTELRRTSDGKRILVLERADITRLEAAGWKPPERFVAKGRDGTTDIHGVIHRPTNFDPKKSYPVIEYIYAGPHGHFVPKKFRPLHGSVSATAELGFVVVQMDGMGTNGRSKAFHDVCWKNLGDSGFPDRIAWIKAAAAKYPSLDIKRGVGIYGGSAGGQSSTRAVLAHGDFYTVAVSDCGCHDNRMDKIWWNEMWMGWPVGPHYAEQSNVTNAKRLTGKLMLVVGELDRNVDPSSTMQVANALIAANKDFDLLVMPGVGHGAAETPYASRRRADFFVRHLMGVEPRSK